MAFVLKFAQFEEIHRNSLQNPLRDIKHTTAMLQVNKEANVGYNAENLKQRTFLEIGCKSADGNVQFCSVLQLKLDTVKESRLNSG